MARTSGIINAWSWGNKRGSIFQSAVRVCRATQKDGGLVQIFALENENITAYIAHLLASSCTKHAIKPKILRILPIFSTKNSPIPCVSL